MDKTEDFPPKLSPINKEWQKIAWDSKHYFFHLKSFLFVENKDIELDRKEELELLKELEPLTHKKKPSTPPPQTIITLSLNLVQKCNLACEYCFAGKEGDYNNKSTMDYEVAIKAISLFLAKSPRVHINFFGGEPLLAYSSIKRIIAWSKQQTGKLSFAMTTNGVLLNQERIEYFKKNKVSLTISYDGQKLQKKQRPQKNNLSSNEIIAYKLKTYRKILYETQSYIRSTYPLDDIKLIQESIEEITTHFNQGFSFLPPLSNKKQQTKESFKRLEKILMIYIKEKPQKALQLLNIRLLVEKIKKQKYEKSYCQAGISYFTVSSSGDFYICHRFNENKKMKVGSIHEGLTEKPLRKKIESYRLNKQEPCKSCWIRYICQGGCLYEHSFAREKNSFFCAIQKMEVKLALYYIKISS